MILNQTKYHFFGVKTSTSNIIKEASSITPEVAAEGAKLPEGDMSPFLHLVSPQSFTPTLPIT